MATITAVASLLLTLLGLPVFAAYDSPDTHLDRVFVTDCDGSFRFLPDNALLNVNVKAEVVPRLLRELYAALRSIVDESCLRTREEVTEEEFFERFNPFSAPFYASRLFEEGAFDPLKCLDKDHSYARDFRKVWEATFGDTEVDTTVETCTYTSWVTTGRCAFVVGLPRGLGNGTSLRFSLESCGMFSTAYAKMVLACEGPGCKILTPCATHEDCGGSGPNDLRCEEPLGYLGAGSDDLYRWLQEPGVFPKLFSRSLYETMTVPSCPRVEELIPLLLKKFAPLVPGAAAEPTGFCLPNRGYFTDLKESATNLPSASGWRKRDDPCAELPPIVRYDTPDRTKFNATDGAFVFASQREGERIPHVVNLTAYSPFLLTGNGSVLRGNTRVTSEYPVGGGACSSDAECSNGSCRTLEEFCDLFDTCRIRLDGVDRVCGCLWSNRDRMLSVGAWCESSYLGAKSHIEECGRLTLNGSKTLTLRPWDGTFRASSPDPFEPAPWWPAFPDAATSPDAPPVLSTGCGGVVSLFPGTPAELAVFVPALPSILEAVAELNIASWKCSYKASPEFTLSMQAPWRPEPWLFHYVVERDGARSAPPKGYSMDNFWKSSFMGLLGLSNPEGRKLLFFPRAGNLSMPAWARERYLGAEFTAAERVLGGWSATVRVEECPDHPLSFPRVTVGCAGRACEDIMLQHPCRTDSDCYYSTCNKAIRSFLHGEFPPASSFPNFVLWSYPTRKTYSTCPALRPMSRTTGINLEVGAEVTYSVVPRLWALFWKGDASAGEPFAKAPVSFCFPRTEEVKGEDFVEDGRVFTVKGGSRVPVDTYTILGATDLPPYTPQSEAPQGSASGSGGRSVYSMAISLTAAAFFLFVGAAFLVFWRRGRSPPPGGREEAGYCPPDLGGSATSPPPNDELEGFDRLHRRFDL